MMPKTKSCPYCAEDIKLEAVKCKHCGEWLAVERSKDKSVVTDNTASTSTEQSAQQHQNNRLQLEQSTDSASNALPLTRFVILQVLSGGLYIYLWFFRTYSLLAHHFQIKQTPKAEIVKFLFPGYNIVAYYKLSKTVSGLAAELGVKRVHLTATPVVLLLCILLCRLPYSWSLVGLIALLSPVIIQNTLNRLWRTKDPGTKSKWKPDFGEIAIVCIGAAITYSLFSPKWDSAIKQAAYTPPAARKPLLESRPVASNWQFYRYPEKGFGVAFPSQPKLSNKRAEDDASVVESRLYESSDETSDCAYFAMVRDITLKPGYELTSDDIYDYTARTMAESINGKLLSQENIDISGHAGQQSLMEARIKGTNVRLKLKMVLVKERLYIFYVTEQGDSRSPGAQRFLDSFQLL